MSRFLLATALLVGAAGDASARDWFDNHLHGPGGLHFTAGPQLVTENYSSRNAAVEFSSYGGSYGGSYGMSGYHGHLGYHGYAGHPYGYFGGGHECCNGVWAGYWREKLNARCIKKLRQRACGLGGLNRGGCGCDHGCDTCGQTPCSCDRPCRRSWFKFGLFQRACQQDCCDAGCGAAYHDGAYHGEIYQDGGYQDGLPQPREEAPMAPPAEPGDDQLPRPEDLPPGLPMEDAPAEDGVMPPLPKPDTPADDQSTSAKLRRLFTRPAGFFHQR